MNSNTNSDQTPLTYGKLIAKRLEDSVTLSIAQALNNLSNNIKFDYDEHAGAVGSVGAVLYKSESEIIMVKLYYSVNKFYMKDKIIEFCKSQDLMFKEERISSDKKYHVLYFEILK